MHRLPYLCFAALACLTLPGIAQAQQLLWQESSTGCEASLRGLSVVDDQTLWASGAKATVVRSVDAGASWQSCGPQGFDQLEFRSIVALDDQTATLASAGTPAVILQTCDGGRTWNETFRHPSPAAFFDGMRFWRSRARYRLQRSRRGQITDHDHCRCGADLATRRTASQRICFCSESCVD